MEYQRTYDPASGQRMFWPQPGDAPRIGEPFMAAPYQPTDSPIDPYVGFSGPVSIGDIHDPTASSAPTVSPPSDAPIGDLGGDDYPVDQGIESIDGIGEGPSGIRPLLTLPSDDDLPTDLPPTSPISGQVPLQDPPVAYTTPFVQRW
jgi:hypothetical protein